MFLKRRGDRLQDIYCQEWCSWNSSQSEMYGSFKSRTEQEKHVAILNNNNKKVAHTFRVRVSEINGHRNRFTRFSAARHSPFSLLPWHDRG